MVTKEFDWFTFWTPKECYSNVGYTEEDFFDDCNDSHDLLQAGEEEFNEVWNEFNVGVFDSKQDFLDEWFIPEEGDSPDGDDYYPDENDCFENDWLWGLNWLHTVKGKPVFAVLYKTKGQNAHLLVDS